MLPTLTVATDDMTVNSAPGVRVANRSASRLADSRLLNRAEAMQFLLVTIQNRISSMESFLKKRTIGQFQQDVHVTLVRKFAKTAQVFPTKLRLDLLDV